MMAQLNLIIVGYLLFVLTTAISATYNSNSTCGKPVTNTGREFVLGILTPWKPRTAKITLVIASDSSGNLEMISPRLAPSHTVHTLRNGSTVIQLSNSLISNGTGINRNGIRLVADVDVRLYIQILSTESVLETMSVYPINALSNTYTAVTESGLSASDGQFHAMCLVVAVNNNTQVSIRLPHGLGADINVNLNEFDTYEYIASDVGIDITGASVTSNKEIGVFCGSQLAKVPNGISAGNAIFESMVPRESWDNLYIVPPAPPQQGFMVKIVHGDTDTAVNLFNHSTAWNTTIRGLEHVEMLSGLDPLVVKSDRPVMVAQLGTSFRYKYQNTGDPDLTIVPGVSQYLDNYDFVVRGFEGDPFTHYLAVTVLSTEEQGIVLDGRRLNVTFRYPVSEPMSNYSVVIATVTEGYHSLKSLRNVTFGAVLYGFRTNAGYAMPAGVGFTNQGKDGCHRPQTEQTSQCLACTDMSDPGLCDNVQQCLAHQICFVVRYQKSIGHVRYRSGCIDKNKCSGGGAVTGDTCLECCSGDFCNLRGCGSGAVPRDQRGPFCFECDHVNDTKQCDYVTLCAPNQACGIEQHRWGGVSYNYIMGCQDRQACVRRKRSLTEVNNAKRSSLACFKCCDEDFCNNECQNQNVPNIIG